MTVPARSRICLRQLTRGHPVTEWRYGQPAPPTSIRRRQRNAAQGFEGTPGHPSTTLGQGRFRPPVPACPSIGRTPTLESCLGPKRVGSSGAPSSRLDPPILPQTLARIARTPIRPLLGRSVSVQISWPPAFSSRGRSCADLLAASVQVLMSLHSGVAAAADLRAADLATTVRPPLVGATRCRRPLCLPRREPPARWA